MSGRRRGPVGPGYMPKGGVRAAQEHNRTALANKSAGAPRPGPMASAAGQPPPRHDVREDVRASARPDVRRLGWRGPAAAASGAAGGVVLYELARLAGVFG